MIDRGDLLMRRAFFAVSALGLALSPASAMDMGCSPASKVTARAPVEAPAKVEEARATPVTDEQKAEALRTAAAPKQDDRKVQ
jgi:hypothetical protein